MIFNWSGRHAKDARLVERRPLLQSHGHNCKVQLSGCVSCSEDKLFFKNTFVDKSICTDPCRPLSPPSSTYSHSGICSQQPLKLLGLVLPETRQASHQWQDRRTTMSTCSMVSAIATTSSTFSRLNSPKSYLLIHLTTC